MSGFRSVLYRPSWQRLRVSMLTNNHPNGGFNTEAGTNDNLQRLDNYINDAVRVPTPEYVTAEIVRMKITVNDEYACRVWRGLNMLNATHMGFSGIGRSGSPMDMAVVAYRDKIQEFYNGHLVMQTENKWDWKVIQFELEELWRNERYWFEKIYDDLNRRSKVATRRRSQSSGPQVDATRPELLRFLALMEAINRG